VCTDCGPRRCSSEVVSLVDAIDQIPQLPADVADTQVARAAVENPLPRVRSRSTTFRRGRVSFTNGLRWNRVATAFLRRRIVFFSRSQHLRAERRQVLPDLRRRAERRTRRSPDEIYRKPSGGAETQARTLCPPAPVDKSDHSLSDFALRRIAMLKRRRGTRVPSGILIRRMLAIADHVAGSSSSVLGERRIECSHKNPRSSASLPLGTSRSAIADCNRGQRGPWRRPDRRHPIRFAGCSPTTNLMRAGDPPPFPGQEVVRSKRNSSTAARRGTAAAARAGRGISR